MLETILGWFAFGHVAFWFMFGGFFVSAFFSCADDDSPGWTTCASILLVALVWSTYYWVVGASYTVGTFVSFLVCYLAIGLGWALWSWFGFIKDKAEDYKRETDRLKARYPNISEAQRLNESLQALYKDFTHTLVVTNHKQRVYCWLMFWPISTCTDGIYRAYMTILNLCRGVFDRLAKRAARDVVPPQ